MHVINIGIKDTTLNACTYVRVSFSVVLFFFYCIISFLPAKAQVDAEMVTLLGRNALSVDDYLTAIKYFNQAIEAKPYLSRPYYYRAYAKFTLEDYKGAESDCDKSIELNPFIVDVYQFRGLCRINNNDYKGAIEDYSRVLQETPSDQGSRFNRALCYLQTKDYTRADTDLDYMLKHWPNYYRTYMVKAQSLFEQNDSANAILLIDSLLGKNPREDNAWAVKGRYAFEKGDYLMADSCLTQAITINPENYNLYISRALARHSLGKFDLAISDYNKAIEIVPQHFVAHYNRGLLRSFVGDLNRAIEDFNFVISIEPDNDLAIYNRAQLRSDTGDYRGAIEDYSTLINKYPNFTYGYISRAHCSRMIGDYKKAIKDETVVAKQNLDLAYGKNTQKSIKKVRTRSEHDLDQYQQLIDEESDTTRNIFGTLYGKVQNENVTDDFMPMYHLAFRPIFTQGYHSIGFMPELARIEQFNNSQRKFCLTAEKDADAVSISDSDLAFLESHEKYFTKQEQCLIASSISTIKYDYTSALNEINEAALLDTTSTAALIQKAYILTRSIKSSNLETKDIQARLNLALYDLKRASSLSPGNAYVKYNMGCLYKEMQKYKQALDCFNQAIALDEQLPEAYYNRGLIHKHFQDKNKAVIDFSKAGQLGLYKAYAQIKKTEKETK